MPNGENPLNTACNARGVGPVTNRSLPRSQTRQRLLNLLHDGRIHSGSELAGALRVSRTTVWNQVEVLKGLGVPITSLAGRGYRLHSGLDALDEVRVLSHLPAATRRRIDSIDWFDRIDSTSDQLLRGLAETQGRTAVCIAESQTGGRGRRGRSWVSPFGCNLYFSVAYRFSAGVSGLVGLTPALGVALAQRLSAAGVKEIQVKWPNDLLLDGRKTAGVLVDLRGDAAGPCWAVVGVGVNLTMSQEVGRGVDQPWANVGARLAAGVERSDCLGILLAGVLVCLHTVDAEGPETYLRAWDRFDALKGKVVQVDADGDALTGVAGGVSERGLLKLMTASGERLLMAGEVSVRDAEVAAD